MAIYRHFSAENVRMIVLASRICAWASMYMSISKYGVLLKGAAWNILDELDGVKMGAEMVLENCYCSFCSLLPSNNYIFTYNIYAIAFGLWISVKHHILYYCVHGARHIYGGTPSMFHFRCNYGDDGRIAAHYKINFTIHHIFIFVRIQFV